MQSNCAVDLRALQAQTERLTAAVLELQVQLQAIDAGAAEDEWNVWPYNWCIQTWRHSLSLLHSFHGNLAEQRLALRNRRLLGLRRQATDANGSLRLV